MNNQIEIVLEGKFGGFFPPQSNVERFSYSFINPSAARGCLESILYKKEFIYQIKQIHILSDIIHESIKVNEVKHLPSLKNPTFNPEKYRTQRNQYVLINPSYLIKADIIITKEGEEGLDSHGGKNTPKKYFEMFNRRVKRGECFHNPCFGQRQFFADFRQVEKTDVAKNINLIERNMIYDCFDLDKPRKKNYNNRLITFFDAVIKNGILNIPDWKEIKKENS